MKKICLGLLSISGFVAFLVMGPGTGWAEHSWGDYHWARTANPIELKVVDSVSDDWQYEFNMALAEWNLSDELDMRVGSANDSNRTRKRCKMQTGQMRVCNASYGYNGWLGMATIGINSNGHIDKGTAKMNDSYASYWADPDEKRHVMCQEIGHVFGLGHTSVDRSSQGTCMDYSSAWNSISPNSHDYQLLAEKYGHQDSYNSYDDGSSSDGDTGGNKPCNPKKPGCSGFDLPASIPAGAVRMHRGPHAETWVKGRPDGGLWIFHVRLAPRGGHGHHD
ncbi:MAG: hypothetical protein VST67_09215 [Nitrospirota bacterium]|nr:hypothetical protein [Nitrospirota bacterium]